MDLNFLIEVIKNRKVNYDNKSYTSSLFRKGLQECCKKFGEESVEVIIAALEKKESNLKEEVADLMYHLLVLLEVSDCLLYTSPSPRDPTKSRMPSSA